MYCIVVCVNAFVLLCNFNNDKYNTNSVNDIVSEKMLKNVFKFQKNIWRSPIKCVLFIDILSVENVKIVK